MRNNRIEHLIEATYATKDRAFYIYLDEATDGYTMENNWCPAERFDSNRPGKKNVWKNNGPQVADSIKYKATHSLITRYRNQGNQISDSSFVSSILLIKYRLLITIIIRLV